MSWAVIIPASSCHRSWQWDPLYPAEQSQCDGTAMTEDGTCRTDFISQCHGREESMRCPKQPGAHLAVCKDLFAGMAAKGPTAAQGQENRCCDPLTKAPPSEPFLSHIASQPLVAALGCLQAAALPAPAAQALQDPNPKPLTSGHWVEDVSQLLTAPTLGKHRWELSFLETVPQHLPPSSPPASRLVSFWQTQCSQGCPESRDKLCRAAMNSPITEIKLLN